MTLPPQDGEGPEPGEPAEAAATDVPVADAGPAATDPDGIPTVGSPPSAPPYAAPPPNAPPYAAPFGAAPPYQEPYGPGYAAEDLPLGGRWRRLFAGIVDAIIVVVITGLVTGAVSRPHAGYTARDGFADVLGLAIGIAYFWIQHGAWGQTIGKRIFQLRVVDLTGGRITWGQAGIRVGFQYLISVVTCGVGEIVDLAWILFDRRKQALHDKVAKTLVVSA